MPLLAVLLDPDKQAVYHCATAHGGTVGVTTKRLITLGGALPNVAVPLRAIAHCFVRRCGLLRRRYAVVGVTADGEVRAWVECADQEQCTRIVSAIQAARLYGVRVG